MINIGGDTISNVLKKQSRSNLSLESDNCLWSLEEGKPQQELRRYVRVITLEFKLTEKRFMLCLLNVGLILQTSWESCKNEVLWVLQRDSRLGCVCKQLVRVIHPSSCSRRLRSSPSFSYESNTIGVSKTKLEANRLREKEGGSTCRECGEDCREPKRCNFG